MQEQQDGIVVGVAEATSSPGQLSERVLLLLARGHRLLQVLLLDVEVLPVAWILENQPAKRSPRSGVLDRVSLLSPPPLEESSHNASLSEKSGKVDVKSIPDVAVEGGTTIALTGWRVLLISPAC